MQQRLRTLKWLPYASGTGNLKKGSDRGTCIIHDVYGHIRMNIHDCMGAKVSTLDVPKMLNTVQVSGIGLSWAREFTYIRTYLYMFNIRIIGSIIITI